MSRQPVEIADIFRVRGESWRKAHQGHISLDQLKVMSAIENCRSAELGGHVLICTDCGYQQIAYNSCRNRHCPKCQGSVAHRWLEARQGDLLPVDYYHLVFTLPAPISNLAYSNKSVIYTILFKTAEKTLQTIAADPKHLGAKVGFTLVLHTWGSSMIHHPHVHGIVPGGGLSLNGKQWVPCRPGFFLSVRVLSCLFRRLFLEKLNEAYQAGQLKFFGEHKPLKKEKIFTRWIKPLKKIDWVVYAKPPFAGPESVLAYLSRYTHRVAISNSRLLRFDGKNVTFKWKDYRGKKQVRYKTMTLDSDEFIRRFLIHVLPGRFHRIRHYGILANSSRQDNLKRARELLKNQAGKDSKDKGAIKSKITEADKTIEIQPATYVCPKCDHPMLIIESFMRGQMPRAPPESIR